MYGKYENSLDTWNVQVSGLLSFIQGRNSGNRRARMVQVEPGVNRSRITIKSNPMNYRIFDARFTLLLSLETESPKIGCYAWWLGRYLYIGRASNGVNKRAVAHLPIMQRRLGALALREVEIHVWNCKSELESRLLEGKLIVRLRPKFNRDYLI